MATGLVDVRDKRHLMVPNLILARGCMPGLGELVFSVLPEALDSLRIPRLSAPLVNFFLFQLTTSTPQ